MIDLVHAMTYRLEVSGPLGEDSATSTQYWEMTRATLEGPRISATSAYPGADWFTPLGEAWGRPHVRIAFRTDDGVAVLLEYRGLIHVNDRFTDAVTRDTSTGWDDHYMRMLMWFDTASPDYAWLRHHVFLARGRLLGATMIEYDVYQVS